MQDIIQLRPILSLLPMCTTDVGLSIIVLLDAPLRVALGNDNNVCYIHYRHIDIICACLYIVQALTYYVFPIET